ncbi:MAG: adenylate/guanylate cyclase domain-containing protein [Cyanobacteria bacterium P01_D01_bin.156]
MTALETVRLHTRRQGLPIGLKIFGLTASLLGLMVMVVGVSTRRLGQVNEEIINLADYALPITDRVAQIDVHVLEQELHFERVQTLYEIEPLDEERLQSELAGFMERGQQVDEEIETAIALVQTAIDEATIPEVKAKWQSIAPRLMAIETEHQLFQTHTSELLELLAAGDLESAHQLEETLVAQEVNFNQSVNDVFLELENFTVKAAQSGQYHQQVVQTLSASIAGLATLAGLAYATLVTLGLVRPVRSLKAGTTAVQTGDLDVHLDTSSRDEVGTLARAFNTMVDELRLKARLEETFGKYVDPRIVKSLVQSSNTAATDGERQIMTVFFAQVQGMETGLAPLAPTDQERIINDYLSLMSAPISNHDGVIDKFIGTMIMGFWGPPFTDEDNHARLACEAALASLDQLTQLQPKLAQLAMAQTQNLHIGLATGPLVVGNMGSEAAKAYTVMGDTVNIASRLKGVSQQYGATIVINEATQQQVADVMATRELDLIRVVGKEDAIHIYELLGRKDAQTAADEGAIAAFSQGLTAYRQQDWEQARQHFTQCLDQKPGDRPTLLYLDRITQLEANPPDTNWDGVWQLTRK